MNHPGCRLRMISCDIGPHEFQRLAANFMEARWTPTDLFPGINQTAFSHELHRHATLRGLPDSPNVVGIKPALLYGLPIAVALRFFQIPPEPGQRQFPCIPFSGQPVRHGRFIAPQNQFTESSTGRQRGLGAIAAERIRRDSCRTGRPAQRHHECAHAPVHPRRRVRPDWPLSPALLRHAASQAFHLFIAGPPQDEKRPLGGQRTTRSGGAWGSHFRVCAARWPGATRRPRSRRPSARRSPAASPAAGARPHTGG